MLKIGLHEHIEELQKSDDPRKQMIGFTLARVEMDLDQLSGAIAMARMHEVDIPPTVRPIIEGFRSQLRQTAAACGKQRP